MAMQSTFKTPTPKPWLMKLLSPLTRILFLKGIPLFRDIPGLNRIPGIRGLTHLRHIDFPESDVDVLKRLHGKQQATFYLPNHPEFFTDWMMDKYVLSRVAPQAASWATGEVVNGMGKFMQRFWLNNNVIAQIPGESDEGKRCSINCAVHGHGVLLHPEGQVGWNNRYISTLFTGAAQMAVAAVQQGRKTSHDFTSWLAPLVWSFRFNQDVKKNLLSECDYIEKRLKLDIPHSDCAGQRVYDIYLNLARRDFYTLIDSDDCFSDRHLIQIQDDILAKAKRVIESVVEITGMDEGQTVRTVSKWLRQHKTDERFKEITQALILLQTLVAS